MLPAKIGTANWQIGRLVDLEREADDDGQSQSGLRITVGLVRATFFVELGVMMKEK